MQDSYRLEKDVSHLLTQKERKQKWALGYHKSNDFISISKTGWIGKIVQIEGINIGLPSTKGYSIKFKRENKFVKETDFSKVTEENAKMYTEQIKDCLDCIDMGCWFWNNGEETYLTPLQYYLLNLANSKGGSLNFRYTQWILSIFIEACYYDDRCDGTCLLKNRRMGYTELCIALASLLCTTTENFDGGLISKDEATVQKAFKTKFLYSYKKLPYFFKPHTNQKLDRANNIKSVYFNDLENTFGYESLSINAFDGDGLDLMLLDECGKWRKEVDFYEYYTGVTMDCISKGSKRGFILAGSTTNQKNKGGLAFQRIIQGSNPRQRNIKGKTSTGLYYIFIPATYCQEDYIDEYGFPILLTTEPVKNNRGKWVDVGSIAVEEDLLEHLKKTNLKGYYARKRNHPQSLDDAFMDGSDECSFSDENINTQQIYCDNSLGSLYERGDLHWSNGMFSDVYFTPNVNGKYLISKHPPQDKKNNVSLEGNNYVMNNTHLFYGGGDSYDISKASVKGSNGSFHIVAGSSLLGYEDKVVLEYTDRPKTSTMFYDNVMKCCFYYGCNALLENNKYAILKYFKENYCKNLVVNNPLKKKKDLRGTEKEWGGIWSDDRNKIEHAEGLNTYINNNVGGSTEENLNKLVFEDCLEELLYFDINNREKFDRVISLGYALMYKNSFKNKLSRVSAQRNCNQKESIMQGLSML